MLEQQEIEALRQRQFVLKCSSITLTQRGVEAPRSLSGSGRLFQTSEGRLEFESYVHTPEYPPFAFLRPGDQVPESEYFDLIATDWKGRNWSATWVDVREDFGGPVNLSLPRGEVRSLEGVENLSAGSPQEYLLLGYVFSSVAFPKNNRSIIQYQRGSLPVTSSNVPDIAEFRAHAVDYHLRSEDDFLLVRAAASTLAMPPHYKQRLLESLRFVLARLLSWDVVVERSNGQRRSTIYSRNGPIPEQALPPPIRVDSDRGCISTASFFGDYLQHVLTAEDPEVHHLLSAEWGEVLRAGEGTLQTQAAVLSITVEAVLRMIFRQRPAEVRAERHELARAKQWLRKVRKYLRREGCPTDFLERFDGLFSRMTGLSDRDRLTWLADRGAIDASLEPRWAALRNPSAHADRERQGDEATLFTECMAVLTLLHQLIAHLVGYQGQLSNYVERAWPLRPYPLPARASPPTAGPAGR